jgi:plastocyanin/DNA-binding beta-propeller fold protein YncE
MNAQAPRALIPRILILLGLVAASLPNLSQVRAFPEEEFGLPAAALYVADSSPANALTPLDPATLAPLADRPEVSTGSSFPPVLSADGSTVAIVGTDGGIVVRDGLYGPERLRIDPQAEIGNIALSADGRRLVAEVIADSSAAHLQTPAWKLFDTGNGRLIAAVENAESGILWGALAIDPNTLRLYRLAYDDPSEFGVHTDGPFPSRLIVDDLSTGAEIGRIELPDVLAGFWQGVETVAAGDGEEPLMKQMLPGLALSPDGRSLAIAHADRDALTVIDTEQLAVVRTVDVGRSASFWRRFATELSFAPAPASAKALEGTMIQAVFSPDGRHIYVFGVTSRMEGTMPTFEGLGLRVVDVESGRVTAEALPDEIIDRVQPSPDGGSLYVAGPGGGAGYALRRVDAATLDVLAERETFDWQGFLVQSAMADPARPLTVELIEMEFMPDLVTIPADTDVRLNIVNHGTVRHSFRTGDEAGTWEVRVDLEPGESETITLHAPAGEYKAFCDMVGHPEAGMGGAVVAR